MVQKTVIDTLHKEGKGAQATGMTASLRILSSKANSNTWESFTRSGMKLKSVHQESPSSDVFRKRATKPLPKQKRCQKHLTRAKEKMNWTVARWSKVQIKVNFAFHVEIMVPESGGRREAQNPSCLKSSVKFLKSVMIWGAVTSAGVGPLCFIKCKVNAAIYQEILEHFMLPSADKLLEMLI
ncbi:Transposable element Tcb1 transposase [Labeo rohita]|uniref:Transposable element Tcb1 transposase n=1 Tax=Labeo rohita TaxID=84645 RepID=A0ABQ8LWJ1_LABRO|nr:Transposable element Tcb1 transposase [Labeo rohita]